MTVIGEVDGVILPAQIFGHRFGDPAVVLYDQDAHGPPPSPFTSGAPFSDAGWLDPIIEWLRNRPGARDVRGRIVPERLVGFARRSASLRHVILCVDQSGSMATSVVYAGILGAVLASIKAVRTSIVLFDTAVVDLTEKLDDPVDVLFGTQLGGGTDINRALAYCQSLVRTPGETVFVLVSDLSDLYEGGNRDEMFARAASPARSGVTMVALPALDDLGSPRFDAAVAARFAELGIPAFACTPDLFPDLMAAAIERRDLSARVALNDIVVAT